MAMDGGLSVGHWSSVSTYSAGLAVRTQLVLGLCTVVCGSFAPTLSRALSIWGSLHAIKVNTWAHETEVFSAIPPLRAPMLTRTLL